MVVVEIVAAGVVAVVVVEVALRCSGDACGVCDSERNDDDDDTDRTADAEDKDRSCNRSLV